MSQPDAPTGSRLLEEIGEQPDVLARVLDRETARIAAIGARLRPRVRFVLVAARGSSDNAARYGQYVLGARNRLVVALAAPSLFARGRTALPPAVEGALVLGVSQSGQSPDIVAVLEEARRQGAPTLAITNDPGSPLARAADEVVPLHAGEERSVAATKTYTAELLVLALLSAALDADATASSSLREVPARVAAALGGRDEARAVAALLGPFARCAVVGRGFHLATAHETALKVKELAWVAAEPYSSADFQHGPIALADPGFPVLVVRAGEARAEIEALETRLRAAGSPVAALPRPAGIEGLPAWLDPIPAIVPAQLLAFHLARARGADPDRPRTIAKVTRTS